MIKKEEVYKIGLFNKPHGIHGELQFTFTDDIFDRVDCDYLICLLDGIFVPFFIEEYRFRSDSTALVKLEGVDSAERARMFTNIEVYFPVKHAEEAEDGELSWNFFIGFQMEDIHHGLLGEVIDVGWRLRKIKNIAWCYYAPPGLRHFFSCSHPAKPDSLPHSST